MAVLLFSLTSCAQPQRGQQGPPPLPNEKQITNMVNDVAKELSLTQEQKTQVSELYFEHFNEVKETMKNNRGNREETRKMMDVLKAKHDTNVKALLTIKQQEQFTAYQEKNKPRRGKKGNQKGK